MALLQKVTDHKEAEPRVSQVFEMLETAVGSVPEPLRMLAISPGLFEQQFRMIGYFRDHDRLSPELLTFIRYGAACQFNNPACISFNGSLLKKQGVREEELTAVLQDPTKAPLEENDRALFAFVMKGIVDHASATREDIEQLLALGWRDRDIVDAVQHGFGMYAPGKMIELFQMT